MTVAVFRAFSILAAAIAVVCVSGPDRAARAQAPGTRESKTVWSGVYTDEQAARGKRDYDLYCPLCHGADLDGGDGPGLVGPSFLRNWFEDDVQNLVDKVQSRMPADSPGSLTMSESTDLVAFLLQQNGFPAGAAELSPEPAVQSAIRIESKDGPGPVPTFSLVVVIGCLTEGPDARWLVTHSTEPLRTRESTSTVRTGETALPPLGTQTFQLMDVTSANPQRFKGQKVEVKGLLMRQPSGAALNVVALQPVANSCP